MMRRLLYFFPTPGVNASMLAARGVLDRFTRSDGSLLEHIITPVDNGPGGVGCLVALGSRPCEYSPDRQTWLQGEHCWVGTEDVPPRPQDLIREYIVEGTDVALADGSVWRVPLVVRWSREKLTLAANLPESFRPVIRDGRVTVESSVRPQDRKLMELAEQTFMDFVAERVLPFDEAYPRACQFLNVNYRVGPMEAGVLGILDEDAMLRILLAAVDMRGLDSHRREMANRGLEYVPPQVEGED